MSVSAAVASIIANPFLAIVLAVGVFGWWRLISRDSIFERQRNWFFQLWPHEGYTQVDQRKQPQRGRSVWSGGTWYVTQGTKLGDLVYCPWCLSWWIAIVQFAAYCAFPTVTLGLAFLQCCRVVSGIFGGHTS